MSCVGVHLYHAYNNPVSDILPDSSLSCTEKDWIASRRYRDSQAYRIVLLIGNHYASVLVWPNLAHEIKERIGITAVKRETWPKRDFDEQ